MERSENINKAREEEYIRTIGSFLDSLTIKRAEIMNMLEGFEIERFDLEEDEGRPYSEIVGRILKDFLKKGWFDEDFQDISGGKRERIYENKKKTF